MNLGQSEKPPTHDQLAAHNVRIGQEFRDKKIQLENVFHQWKTPIALMFGYCGLGNFSDDTQQVVQHDIDATLSITMAMRGELSKEENIIDALASTRSDDNSLRIVNRLLTVRQIAEEQISGDVWDESKVQSERAQLLTELHAFSDDPIALVISEITRYTNHMSDSLVNNADGDNLSILVKQKIIENIKRLKTTMKETNDLLNLEHPEIKWESVDIDGLVTSYLEEVRKSGENNNHPINVESEGAIVITSDSRYLRNIVENLVSNALKYSFEDDKPIDVRIRNVNGQCRIDVTDQGIGLSNEQIQKLLEFDRHYRTLNATSHATGTGLGLPYAHSCAKLLGGDILIVSPGLGRGSTISVVLPLTNNK